MARKLTNKENDKLPLQDLEYGEETENMENETHTIGPGIWQETMKNLENETHTIQDLEYVEKTDQRGK